MVLSYEPEALLSGGHEKGITKVAFSPGGKLLATAGLDGTICVWDVISSRLLYGFDGPVSVLSLAWIPPAEDTIICGLQDGNMAILKITSTQLTVSGFWAHAYPVECLAVKAGDNRLASGAHGELLVWSWDEQTSKYRLEHDICDIRQKLPQLCDTDDNPLITSLHWTTSADHHVLLLVGFMYHGLLLLDTTNQWTRIRTVPILGQVASASLSDDGMRLAISNLVRGFDVYSMKSGAPLCTLPDKIGDPYPTPVKFVHGSLALLGGSTSGELHIWDVLDTTTGGPALNVPEDDEVEPRIMHILSVPEREKVLAIDVSVAPTTSVASPANNPCVTTLRGRYGFL